MPPIAVIILNYRNAEDTLACLDSVLQAYGDNPSVFVVVVDNHSGDGSYDRFLQHCQLQEAGDVSLERAGRIAFSEQLLLVETLENGGFAHGNNVGLRAAGQWFAPSFYWLLNNDTVIYPGTCEAFLETHAWFAARPGKIGLMGQKLVSYDDPEVLQAIGGRVNPWTLRTHHLASGERDIGQYDRYEDADDMDYPVGASLFFSRQFLDDVGLMREDFFLYYEELDWLTRARQAGYRHGYMWQVPLRHREGGTIRQDAGRSRYSPISDYFSITSRVRFAWLHCRYRLPVVVGFCLLMVARRLFAGQWRSLWLLLQMKNPVRSPGR